MPKNSLQPDLDLPSSEQLGGLVGRVTGARVGGNGQPPPEARPNQPRSATPARPEELQRLLGASTDENQQLVARVHQLEAEVRGTAAELAKLRGDLRGALRDALTDSLTGLANRRSFDLELSATVARATRPSPAYLMMADIDRFKRVNDVHGHDIGDEVLRIVGEVLRANVRRESLIARVGGDEFGILLPGATAHDTNGIVCRLTELLASRPLVVRGCPEVIERITLSIGATRWRPGESSAQWYARADVALYQAKRRGRNRSSIARMLDPQF